MADELELRFLDGRPPETVLAAWRSDPPPALRSGGFKVVDESYNSLTYEHRFLDWPAKLMVVFSLGLVLLLRGLVPLDTVWRLTARFDRDGEGAFAKTRVTVHGHAGPRTRAALADLTRTGDDLVAR
jgi:hypothetical protein